MRNWTGTVGKLSSNSDGNGVLQVDIGDGIGVGTWNNAYFDIGDNTLIEASSPLFVQALRLSTGQRVGFSGRFLPSDTDCIRERSLTLDGSIQEPEFVFAFEAITPAE